MAAKKKNQQRNKSNVVTIAVVIILMAGIIALATLFPRIMSSSGSSSVTVKVPKITTTLTSSVDGNEHKVQTLFSVKMDKDANKKIDSQLLQEALTGIMAAVDFDAMARAESDIEYLNQHATAELNKYLEDSADIKVYVTGFYVGSNIVLDDVPAKGNDVMKGLFQKMD